MYLLYAVAVRTIFPYSLTPSFVLMPSTTVTFEAAPVDPFARGGLPSATWATNRTITRSRAYALIGEEVRFSIEMVADDMFNCTKALRITGSAADWCSFPSACVTKARGAVQPRVPANVTLTCACNQAGPYNVSIEGSDGFGAMIVYELEIIVMPPGSALVGMQGVPEVVAQGTTVDLAGAISVSYVGELGV